MSISPSLSISTNTCAAVSPRSLKPKGFISGDANTGSVAVPVFSKYVMSPSPLAINRSKSPSLSISTNLGTA